MPSLHKIQNNVARHIKLMDKNLCASLIRHEHIVTTRTKAKRAQVKIEKFLSKAMKQQQELGDKPLKYKLANIDAFDFLQPPDRVEIGSKILKDLSERFGDRQTGFTRIIKLEPRLGEDNAPMSVLELVDSEYEIKFWYTAKIAARLELQGLPLDAITEKNIKKLTQFRNNGDEVFRSAVETCKSEFFNNEVEQEDKQILSNKPNLAFHGGSRKDEFVASKKFKTVPRPSKEAVELPKSPFLA